VDRIDLEKFLRDGLDRIARLKAWLGFDQPVDSREPRPSLPSDQLVADLAVVLQLAEMACLSIGPHMELRSLLAKAEQADSPAAIARILGLVGKRGQQYDPKRLGDLFLWLTRPRPGYDGPYLAGFLPENRGGRSFDSPDATGAVILELPIDTVKALRLLQKVSGHETLTGLATVLRREHKHRVAAGEPGIPNIPSKTRLEKL